MSGSRISGWWYLAPMLALVAIFACYPVIRLIFLSTFDQNLATGLQPVFSGGSNYGRALGDSHFWTAMENTLAFTGIAVSTELVLGLLAALALHHAPIGRDLARTAALIPWVLPTSALALGWIWMFNDQFGIINDLLLRTGLVNSPIVWLGKPATAFWALVLADVWKTTPFIMLLLLAALQTIPRQLYEASAIDGASRWRQFTTITLPLLRPAIFVAVLFRTLQSFGIFDLVYVMTGGGPGGATETVAVYAYRNFMRYLDFGYGAALICVSAAILAVISCGIWLLLGRRNDA